MSDQFPVLWEPKHRHDLMVCGCPTTVPLAMVLAHATQVHRNHGQTVARIMERGGLDPSELVAVLNDRPWRMLVLSDAVAYLKALVANYERGGT